MNRAERRYRQKKKWISRLKKLWNSHVFWNYISPVKTKKPYTVSEMKSHPAKSWQDFTKDKFGVLVKNTGTVMTDNKRLDITEAHKRKMQNRKLSKEDQEEVDEYLDRKENPYRFEDFCGNCDNFPNYNENVKCPFIERFKNGELNEDTEWEKIGCDSFID